jgi:hypothetical protein
MPNWPVVRLPARSRPRPQPGSAQVRRALTVMHTSQTLEILPTKLIFLVAGFLLAVLGRLYLVPLFEGRAQRHMSRLFGAHWTQKKLSISGEWQMRWWVEEEEETTIDGDERINIKQTGNHVTATYELSDGLYFLEGEIGNGRFLTGTWRSQYDGAVYYGAFQVHIEPNSDKMAGRWIGFGTDNTVKGGPVIWSRQSNYVGKRACITPHCCRRRATANSRRERLRC